MIAEGINAPASHGAGAGRTRNISGTSHPVVLLERELTDLHRKPAALTFSSEFVADEVVLSALISGLPDCIVYSDEFNHASMIAGMRNSSGEKRGWRHNDAANLEALLAAEPPSRPNLIEFESVHPTGRDVSSISEICGLAERHGALTDLDEIHGTRLYGPHGPGSLRRAD